MSIYGPDFSLQGTLRGLITYEDLDFPLEKHKRDMLAEAAHAVDMRQLAHVQRELAAQWVEPVPSSLDRHRGK